MGEETDLVQNTYTIEEYFEMEEQSLEKHEFDNGNVIEMAGALIPHNIVSGTFLRLLENIFIQEPLPFWALNSDTKTRLEAFNKFVYADVTVPDGNPEYYVTSAGKVRRDTITNPLLIVEVLSEGTRHFDKGDKLDQYMTIPSFREYVLVEPETPWVRVIHLSDPATDIWQMQTETDPAKSVRLHTLGLDLRLADLYRRVAALPANPA